MDKILASVTEMYAPSKYPAKCIHVVDGDTMDFFYLSRRGQYSIDRGRLIGIDTPERYTTEGKAAKTEVSRWFSWWEVISRYVNLDHLPFTITTSDDRRDSFGRLLIQVTDPDGVDLSEWLRDKGYGELWTTEQWKTNFPR